MKRHHFLFLLLTFCAIPQVSAFAVIAAVPAQTAVAAPEPTPVPVGTPMPAVAVAESAAPPTWAQKLMVAVESLPVIGPVVAKALLYLGILSSILTVLTGTLIGVINMLKGVMNLSGLVTAANALAAFQNGKVMYWLKFVSLFNAPKKPEDA